MEVTTSFYPNVEDVKKASQILKNVVFTTPLVVNTRLSKSYDAYIQLKREDLQQVRSYKIRGAYHKMSSLESDKQSNGIVCASAGNHAQGVALSCKLLKIKGTIYMPATTPWQKIEQVKMFGESFVEIKLEGDTFDDAQDLALEECKELNKTFVHPFDDEKVIEGQATVGIEILEQASELPDYIIVPIGGGGLASGLSAVVKKLSPKTKIIGVEPKGAAAMQNSLTIGENVPLTLIDKFVDGAAVKKVGDLNFTICKELLDEVISVPEGKICQTILDLYNKEAMVVEPAGAMSIAALDVLKDEIQNKKVVCVVSGGNNDITRTAEIEERALLYSNLKHYFIVKFPQRAGALRQFVAEILGPNDDITHFEYTKKSNRENGSAVVGLEIKSPKDLQPLIDKMKLHDFYGDYLNDKPELFQFLV
ncbi:MAG: threonine ammonia-lyase IlvA [Flavobacteriaceae bacterium]|nr:threonine ammonia-lyase IlvA [Flavobacteriaceae bacterium]